jgi:hypothetical protein
VGNQRAQKHNQPLQVSRTEKVQKLEKVMFSFKNKKFGHAQNFRRHDNAKPFHVYFPGTPTIVL